MFFCASIFRAGLFLRMRHNAQEEFSGSFRFLIPVLMKFLRIPP